MSVLKQIKNKKELDNMIKKFLEIIKNMNLSSNFVSTNGRSYMNNDNNKIYEILKNLLTVSKEKGLLQYFDEKQLIELYSFILDLKELRAVYENFDDKNEIRMDIARRLSRNEDLLNKKKDEYEKCLDE